MKTKARKIAPPSCEQLRCRGAWRRLSLTLLVALCCHTAASAEETLTVYDGTYDIGYSPVYGSYTDTKGSASEFVIPSDKLVAMEDGTISALTFYVESKTTDPWPATFQVYIKEIPTTTLTGITGPSTSTVVYTGTLDASDTEMTVTFDDPYTYNGGNLLIGTYVSEGGTYRLADFYGVYQAGNTAWYRKNLSDAGTAGQFIPKTTFTYTPSGSVVTPYNLAASNITYEEATITWSSDQSAWNIAWSTDPDFDPASATTHADNVNAKTYTITGLSQFTDYYVAVQNNISNSEWSDKLHFKTSSIATVGNGWSDDFEGTTCGWELINGEPTNKWAWGTAAKNGGTHALYISNDGGTTNAYTNTGSMTMVYAARLFNFTEGAFKFSYDWLASGETTYDYLRVALIPETASLTAGTSVPTDFSATTLPTGWIALDGGSKLNLETDWQSKVATIDVAAGNYYMVFAWRNDNSGGNNPPAAIDNVSITKINTDKITDLAVSDVTTTTATVSWNGNGDSYNVRYRKQFLSEGFEGGSMPTGWTTEGPGTWSVGTGDFAETTGSHSGDKNAKIADNKRGNVTYLITPSMDLSRETNLTLSFWYINRAYVNDIDGFGVYYRVANGTWTELWSTTTAHGSWTNQEVTLTGLAANYQLGFKMTDNYGYGVGLDDIQILSSADWQTVNDITTTSTTLIGLDANTTYEFQVQGVKAGLTSDWSPIATFNTNIAILTEVNPIAPLTEMNGKQTKVRFVRSGLTPGKYSTICLPYDFTPSETCTFYTFEGVKEENNVWVADILEYKGTLTANTPYIFTTKTATSVTFSNDAVIAAASYSDTNANTKITDWTFQGTYSAINLPKEGEYDYGFAAGNGSEIEIGTFVHLVSGASAAPFRAYLKYTGSDVNWAKAPNRSGTTNGDALPQRIIVRVVGSNGQTTAIGTIDTKTGDITFDSNEWYSLDGLKLNGAPSNSGIYIKDGKKIIVK